MTAIPQTRAASPPNRPAKNFGRSRGITRTASRVLIYGPGGIGKSSLAAAGPASIFADIEHSTEDLNVERIEGVENWADLRVWLLRGYFTGIHTIVIDSATRAEQWCIAHVVANVPHEKGLRIKSVEDYGWGKGYTLVYEEWRRLLGDLESHYRQGRNIVLVAHDIDGKAPNPDGEDFLRHQPRLQNTKEASIMRATVEWCDHVLYIGYDAAVKDGKAKGGGSRTIFCAGTPTVIAKTRNLDGQPMPFPKGDTKFWGLVTSRPASAAADEAPI
jgi:hypothetical protein